MVKTFISMISLQGKGELLKLLYNPKGFTQNRIPRTSFPIVPIIANETEENGEVKVIVIRTDNADTPDNFEVLVQELADLGIGRDRIAEISIAENQSGKNELELMLRLLEEIPEDSLVYADITFGTKPMSAVVLYAMNLIEKVKDAEVEGIYYGEIPREMGKPIYEKAALYDLTAFKYLSDIVEQMKYLEFSNPLASLREMLNLHVQEE